jgi:hypothetical protein
VICKEIIEDREFVMQMCGSDLPLKVNRWSEDNADLLYKLILSILDRIDRSRFKNYIIFVGMVELDKGFRIVSAEEVSVESLPTDMIQNFREAQAAQSDDNCMVMFYVKAANNGETYGTGIPFGMNDDSIFHALQEIADGLKKEEVIKELNKG